MLVLKRDANASKRFSSHDGMLGTRITAPVVTVGIVAVVIGSALLWMLSAGGSREERRMEI